MNNKTLIEAGALRQFKHNDGSEGFVAAYDLDIVNRVTAALEKVSADLEQVLRAILDSRNDEEEYKAVKEAYALLNGRSSQTPQAVDGPRASQTYEYVNKLVADQFKSTSDANRTSIKGAS